MIILGLDPSLSCTGWGVIRVEGSRISHIANGQIKTDAKAPLPDRLAHLDTVLAAVIADHAPTQAAVEEVFVNDNPQSTRMMPQPVQLSEGSRPRMIMVLIFPVPQAWGGGSAKR